LCKKHLCEFVAAIACSACFWLLLQQPALIVSPGSRQSLAVGELHAATARRTWHFLLSVASAESVTIMWVISTQILLDLYALLRVLDLYVLLRVLDLYALLHVLDPSASCRVLQTTKQLLLVRPSLLGCWTPLPPVIHPGYNNGCCSGGSLVSLV
jgi:hypothetical protein